MPRPALGRLSLCLAWLLLAIPLAAQEPIARAPSAEPVPYRYNAADWKKVPVEFLDDAPACILYTATSHLVGNDGSLETITHEIVRLNTRKGIEELGEYQYIIYHPTYQKLTLNEARLHKADGRVVAVEPRSMHLRDVGTDFLVYDHSKRLIITFPTLEVGDVYEVKWTVKGKHPEYQGKFFTRYNLGSDKYPAHRDELFVRVPDKTTLKHAVVGPLAKLTPTITQKNDGRLYHWSGSQLRQFPRDEDLPSKELLRSEVVCSTFASWDDVHKWERHLLRDCWECTPEIKRIVAEVTRGLTDPRDKARALTYWVRRNIRYVSLGERHDYTPHTPARVLANRHGDCKDGAQLLAVMLAEAGLKASLVTLGTRDRGQIVEAVPSPWGSHAITMVTIDGKEHWIDTTAPLAGWDFLPSSDRNRVCYVTDNKQLRLTRTPALTPEENRMESLTQVSIAADGSSRSHRQITYQGLIALLQRDKFHEENQRERWRVMAGRLQDSNSRVRLVRFSLDEPALARFDGPVRAEVEFVTPDHFTGEKEPEGTVSESAVWNYLLGYALDYERKAPLELWEPFEARHTYIVEAPVGFEFVGAPTRKVFRSPWGRFERTGKFVDARYRVVQVDFHFRLEKTLVEPKDFAEFRRFHQEVQGAYRGWLTLERRPLIKDAGELEALVRMAPEEPTHALTLARVYLAEKKPSEARRVLRYALYYAPQSEALWAELIKTATDRDEKEEFLREVVKHHPDHADHAIELGALLVDRGRHEEAGRFLKAAAETKEPKKQALANYHLARNAYAQKFYQLCRLYLNLAWLQDEKTVNTVEMHVLRARAGERLSEPAEAAKSYLEAVRLAREEQLPEPLVGLIRVSLLADKPNEATVYLRRYLTLDDRDLGRLTVAGEAALRLGRLEDALDLAARLSQPDLSERLRGLVWLRRGDMAKAAEHLRKGLATSDALAGLLRAELVLADLEAAEKTLTKAKKEQAPSPELQRLCDRATALVARRQAILERRPADQRDAIRSVANKLACAEDALSDGRPADAARLVESAHDLGEGLALRGLLHLEQGRLRLALADAERAVKLSPSEARGWLVRGRVRLERGQTEALADLERAVEISAGKDAECLHSLAEAQFQAGKKAAAVESLRAALKIRDLPEWRRQLDDWQRDTGAAERP